MIRPVPDPSALDSTSLLRHYLAVCNAAIAEHPEHPLFACLLAQGMSAVSGDRFGIGVYHDRTGTPFTHFAVTFRRGGFRIISAGLRLPALSWTVRRGALEAVVSDPQPFIDDPERLDWSWLEVRLGLTPEEVHP